MSTRRITNIAMLSCLSFVGRMTFSFLPNVQPTTAIIIIITLYFGVVDGLLVAILSMLISNMYLGMGVWTIAQIASYSMIVILFHFLAKIRVKNTDNYYLTLVSISGILYGLFISLVQAPFFGWASFIPYYISGVPYDIYHAVGNYFFFIILHPALKFLFIKQNNKIKQT